MKNLVKIQLFDLKINNNHLNIIMKKNLQIFQI